MNQASDSRTPKKSGADRGQQAPEAGAAGGDEIADTPLHREGREEEEGQL